MPKQSILVARAEPPAWAERARPDDPRPLLRGYSVAYVQGGIFAVVDSRYGSQQVAPGDTIPGAGPLLRIEKIGGNGFVLTSLGISEACCALLAFSVAGTGIPSFIGLCYHAP